MNFCLHTYQIHCVRRMFKKKKHKLGNMTAVCQHCPALHFKHEKIKNSNLENPKFGRCCLHGKVALTQFPAPPAELKALLTDTDQVSKKFRSDIRRYNASLSFTSLGVKIDRSVLGGVVLMFLGSKEGFITSMGVSYQMMSMIGHMLKCIS